MHNEVQDLIERLTNYLQMLGGKELKTPETKLISDAIAELQKHTGCQPS